MTMLQQASEHTRRASGQKPWMFGHLKAHSEALSARFVQLCDKIREHVQPFTQLQDFTDHGVKHARKVQENLSRLVPQQLREQLTPFEIFVLLCASCLHDVGMMMAKTVGEPTERIRMNHFLRSRQFVEKNHRELGLDRHEATIIGEICAAHGMPSLDYLRENDYSLHPHGRIRVPLLAALLRLADLLDMTYGRAPELVARNRAISHQSRRHWNLHRWITDVRIEGEPSWDLVIVAMPKKTPDLPFYNLRDRVQKELDSSSLILRSAGLFFKKADLEINRTTRRSRGARRRNPFLSLKPYTSREANLFAGRDREVQEVVQRVIGRRVVIVIGESGTGKTSLVDAGVCPHLKANGFEIVRFSLQGDPVSNLARALAATSDDARCACDLLAMSRERVGRSKTRSVLLIGDHLEQLFTVSNSGAARGDFVYQVSRIVESNLPVTMLFCMREDYLPDLYNLSLDFPEFYKRENTFRLHRLSRDNAVLALKRASGIAKNSLAPELVEAIADDLANEGGGLVYPPFLQIIGYRLYLTSAGSQGIGNVLPLGVYRTLGRVERIVSQYLEGLLDGYSNDEKAIVARMLSLMVTQYHTKKRTTEKEIQLKVPHCKDVTRLLSRLVQQRIIKRSLGEYELIHDFLAQKVLDFVQQKRYLSRRVRSALEFIDTSHARTGLTVPDIADAAGVRSAHLAGLFKRELGTTIKKELARIRVSHARRYMRQDNDPLSTVARKCGFGTINTFSRKFRELEGESPQEYKRVVRERERERDLRSDTQ